jgi:hypothetical protein
MDVTQGGLAESLATGSEASRVYKRRAK